MTGSPHRKSRSFVLANDTLESRDLPATFGFVWPNAEHLTISFAPEATTINGRSNELNSVLGSQFGASLGSAGTAQSAWKTAILKAFSAWSSQANINFSPVADNGSAFGSNGEINSDSRFGDIRLGGIKLTNNALAISIPYDPASAGTNSGDIILNTNLNLNDTPEKLYRVALHEIGHTLGVDNSSTSDSVMAVTLSNRLSLSSADIAAIQGLYGARMADTFDAQASNGTEATSTNLSRYVGSGSKPVLLFGDLTTTTDRDFYSFTNPYNYSGPVSVRLQTSNVSLLNAKVTLLASDGSSLAQATVNQLGGGTASLTLPSSTPGATYTIKVESLENNSFQVGAYGMAITFDGRNEVSGSVITSALNGQNLDLSPSQLQLLVTEGVNHEDPAEKLPASKVGTRTNYTVSNQFHGSDSDTYKINPQAGRGPVATIRISSLGSSIIRPTVTLTDASGRTVASRVLLNNGQQMTIEATGISSSDLLRIRVQSESGQAGNYRLDATFGSVTHNPMNFLSGQVSSSTNRQTFKFYVAKPQLFQISSLVQSQSGNSANKVAWTIINSQGQVVWSYAAGNGPLTTGDSVLLNAGEYRMQARYVAGNTTSDTLNFQLTGDIISDPIGPVGIDATVFPQYQDPNIPGIYIYPGGVVIDQSFYIFVIPDPNYDPYGNLGTGGWIA
ncbi:MAG: matrixin family metalloprotease, partial [bacterium]